MMDGTSIKFACKNKSRQLMPVSDAIAIMDVLNNLLDEINALVVHEALAQFDAILSDIDATSSINEASHEFDALLGDIELSQLLNN